MRRHKVYGVVHIPRDFSSNLNQGRQTHVTAFCDASSLLYYKAISLATINVSLEMNADIKLHRARNITARQDEITSAPLRYEEVNIFNPATGMATFLLPAVLMMILQQTMMLGIGVTAGTMKERHTFRLYRPFAPGFAGAATITAARALIYVAVYAVISMYVLGMVPLMFRFTHIGHFTDIALFMLPYLTAGFNNVLVFHKNARVVHAAYSLPFAHIPFCQRNFMAGQRRAAVLEIHVLSHTVNFRDKRLCKT